MPSTFVRNKQKIMSCSESTFNLLPKLNPEFFFPKNKKFTFKKKGLKIYGAMYNGVLMSNNFLLWPNQDQRGRALQYLSF